MALPKGPGDEPRERELAGVLHEVANALTVVLGWLESARERAHEPDFDAARALEVAHARARQAQLIARRAIGAEGLDEELPRPLGAVVREALVGLEPEARRADVRLVNTVTKTLELSLLPAGDRVVQILTNLLLNAIALSPPGARVTVSGQMESNGAATLSVSDEGPGVPASLRPQIFAGGRTTRPGGAGIGLRHAHLLAVEYGGSLRLDDTSVAGARFDLTWPTGKSDTAPPPTRPVSSRIPLTGVRILILEDDEAVVDLLDTALSARGATIHAIRRGADLDKALSSGPFDAALLDISPIAADVSGAVTRVHGHNPDARIVVISGSALSLPPLPDGCRAEWVRKPFEVAEIVEAVLRDG